MENRFKLRISSMFRSSFGSCRTRNISDVIEKAVFSPQNHNNFHLIESSSSSPPKARPFPSICKPRCPESTQGPISHDCIMITPRETLPRRKVSARYPSFLVSAADFDGRQCPPTSPIAPLSLFSDCKDFGFYERKNSLARHKKTKMKNNKKVHVKSKNLSSATTFFSLPSQESATYNNNNNNYNYNYRMWWFSSEDATETIFSSRTPSSDSSDSRRKHFNYRKTCNTRRRRAKNRSYDMGVLPLEGTNKVKDSFAVVKSSSDPYNDFRTSMMEMIVERQIFAAKDLEQLLQCFLSLNSHHHHRIIVEVFTEIWGTLFSKWFLRNVVVLIRN
ncbi:transcription repressor OFP8-like [Durio zibethinus]|uniref:Transcription repressor n=1 Tax=Durio zibethinus TaxID=66656 RepID=A0A6P5XL34_DURZI|nr:transcription repressor OFP8-like [Durio zibethinus]